MKSKKDKKLRRLLSDKNIKSVIDNLKLKKKLEKISKIKDLDIGKIYKISDSELSVIMATKYNYTLLIGLKVKLIKIDGCSCLRYGVEALEGYLEGNIWYVCRESLINLKQK